MKAHSWALVKMHGKEGEAAGISRNDTARLVQLLPASVALPDALASAHPVDERRNWYDVTYAGMIQSLLQDYSILCALVNAYPFCLGLKTHSAFFLSGYQSARRFHICLHTYGSLHYHCTSNG